MNVNSIVPKGIMEFTFIIHFSCLSKLVNYAQSRFVTVFGGNNRMTRRLMSVLDIMCQVTATTALSCSPLASGDTASNLFCVIYTFRICLTYESLLHILFPNDYLNFIWMSILRVKTNCMTTK